MKNYRQGFTIVELLIVIIVIAILAAISIAVYTGIQGRARDSAARSELNNLSKQIEFFMVDDGAPPNTYAEWGQVLRKASLFDNTRIQAEKAFMLCSTATDYAVVVGAPLTVSPTYIYMKNGVIGTANWDNSVPGTYTLDKACGQPSVLSAESLYRFWSSQAI